MPITYTCDHCEHECTPVGGLDKRIEVGETIFWISVRPQAAGTASPGITCKECLIAKLAEVPGLKDIQW